LRRKSLEFERVDSVRDLKSIDPSKLTGQKFNLFGAKLERSVKRINDVCQTLLELHCLSIKSGTESGEQANFKAVFLEKLKTTSNINFRPSDLAGSTAHSVSDFVELSSALKELALELLHICKELRLEIDGQRQSDKMANAAASASENGGNDCSLSPLHNLIMVALDIVGRDTTVSLCAHENSGGKQTTMPLIAEALLSAVDALSKSLPVFNGKTVNAFQPRNGNRSDLPPTHIVQAAHHI
jgi:aspartate ammonia-lyase